MSPLLISAILAAGIGVFIYTKVGPHLGYGNAKNVWIVTGVSTFLAFLVCVTLFTFVIHL